MKAWMILVGGLILTAMVSGIFENLGLEGPITVIPSIMIVVTLGLFTLRVHKEHAKSRTTRGSV